MGFHKTTADDRVWQAVRRRIAGIGRGPAVKVGIVGDKAEEEHDDGEGGSITNAELGAIHELGAPSVGIPARSFIVRTFEVKRDELVAIQKKLARALFLGTTTVERALGLIGAWGAGAIKATITQQDIPPPLQPATIAARKRRFGKASTKPLVASGQLVNSITWVMDKESQ